jgi:hypothetical protein
VNSTNLMMKSYNELQLPSEWKKVRMLRLFRDSLASYLLSLVSTQFFCPISHSMLW